MFKDNITLIDSQSILHCCIAIPQRLGGNLLLKEQAEQWFVVSTKGEMADKQVIVKGYTQNVSQTLFAYLRIPLFGCCQTPPVSLCLLTYSMRVLP